MSSFKAATTFIYRAGAYMILNESMLKELVWFAVKLYRGNEAYLYYILITKKIGFS